jgi:hypothetical protein
LYAFRGVFWRLVPKIGVETLHADAVVVRKEPSSVSEKYLEGPDWQLNRKFGKAFTHWSFICRPVFDLQPVTDATNIKLDPGKFAFVVRGVDVDLSLPVTMWLPFGVSASLREHENGHLKVCDRIYKDASTTAANIAHGFLGQRIEVFAPSRGAAQAQAAQELRVRFSKAYASQTQLMADKVNTYYDVITNHGLNSVSSADGIMQAFEKCSRQK